MTMTQPGAGATGRRAPEKPLPRPDNKHLTAPFWEATKRHELVMQRCNKCSNWIFYPREQCPNCFSQDLKWEKVSGNGHVYAVTIVYQPAHPAFEPEVPYAYAIVQLDEGLAYDNVSAVLGRREDRRRSRSSSTTSRPVDPGQVQAALNKARARGVR